MLSASIFSKSYVVSACVSVKQLAFHTPLISLGYFCIASQLHPDSQLCRIDHFTPMMTLYKRQKGGTRTKRAHFLTASMLRRNEFVYTLRMNHSLPLLTRRCHCATRSGGGGGASSTTPSKVVTIVAATGASIRYVPYMYSQWAAKSRQCTAEELMRGARQAYLGLGALLQMASRAPPKEIRAVVLDEDRRGAPQQQLEKEAPQDTSVKSTQSSSASSNKSELHDMWRALPLGTRLRGELLHSMKQLLHLKEKGEHELPRNTHNEGGDTTGGSDADDAAVQPERQHWMRRALTSWWGSELTVKPLKKSPFLTFAHPNDYILSATLVSFEDLTALEESATQYVFLSNVSPTHIRDEHAEGCHMTPQEMVPIRIDKTTRKSARSKHWDSDLKEWVGAFPVSVSSQTPPLQVPEGALAFACVELKVVTPPRRIYPTFYWMYDRIRFARSENERVALAMMFSTSPASIAVMKFGDAVIRLATGNKAEFVFHDEFLKRIPIFSRTHPLEQCPPCRRKFVGLYLVPGKVQTPPVGNSGGRGTDGAEWVLGEVVDGFDQFDYCAGEALSEAKSPGEDSEKH